MQNKKPRTEDTIKEVSFVEKELLLNSMTQQELLKTTKDLDKTIQELTQTLKVIQENEYLTIHKNKWKLIGYNIFLGMLFAVGTVFGLVLLSWLTFNFFKDSSILNQIVQNQLRMRQLDVSDIREKIQSDLTKTLQEKGTTQSLSGAKTGTGGKTGTGVK